MKKVRRGVILVEICFLLLCCYCQVDQVRADNNNDQNLNNNQQQQPELNIGRSPNAKLYYSKECQDDISRYCLNAKKVELSDLTVLQCIHNEVPDLNLIDKECHNVNSSQFQIKTCLNKFL